MSHTEFEATIKRTANGWSVETTTGVLKRETHVFEGNCDALEKACSKVCETAAAEGIASRAEDGT